ncbi:hypothetical protein SDJN03_16164, partial [Cucurbita argyrosperma subsp. sororia]
MAKKTHPMQRLRVFSIVGLFQALFPADSNRPTGDLIKTFQKEDWVL